MAITDIFSNFMKRFQQEEKEPYISEEFKDQYLPEGTIFNEEAVVESLGKDGWSLMYLEEDFKKDKEMVTLAVEQDGWALKFAHPSLQDDPEVVLTAVGNEGCAIMFASERLQGDKNIAFVAGKNNPMALEYVDEKLLEDPAFMLKVIKEQPSAQFFAGEGILEVEEIKKVIEHQKKIAEEELRNPIKEEEVMLYKPTVKEIETVKVENVGEVKQEVKFTEEDKQALAKSIRDKMILPEGKTLHLEHTLKR